MLGCLLARLVSTSLLVNFGRFSVVTNSQDGSTMRQQRPHPCRSARLASSALSSTLPHFASDDVPEIIEHSTLRLSNVKRLEKGTAGEGIVETNPGFA